MKLLLIALLAFVVHSDIADNSLAAVDNNATPGKSDPSTRTNVNRRAYKFLPFLKGLQSNAPTALGMVSSILNVIGDAVGKFVPPFQPPVGPPNQPPVGPPMPPPMQPPVGPPMPPPMQPPVGPPMPPMQPPQPNNDNPEGKQE
ncbi:hypothetical protein ANCDUO_04147 [Ancylostoma duodenale]|uniref:Uncharacterized protein n=1 Tax=Ancylostoma duodenale TaxID=51022 RepID=A0A0C2DRY6_9BILA|nr:hypothetical protein ANCDUO_04147 [Ancylostoma duodenale]